MSVKQGRGVTFGVMIVILELILLTNTSLFFPIEEVANVQRVMMIYIIMQLMAMMLLFTIKRTQSDIFSLTTYQGLFQFFLGFLVTGVIVLVAVPASIAASFEPLALVKISLLGTILYTFIRAFVEEFLFRDTLEEIIGRYPQAALFGMFHFAVLSIGGAAFLSVLVGAFFLFVLGIIWSYMKDIKIFGILGSTGSHFSYNLHAFGIWSLLFGGG